MKLCSNILLVAVLKALWLQKVSAAFSNIPFSSDTINDSISNSGEIWRSYNTLNGNTDLKKTGPNISYGSRDVQIGNVYSENPDGTNVYGSILVQKNNIFRGQGKNIQYGASIKQVGNTYPKTPGKNDIYAPIVIQEGNTYSENPGKNNVFAAIVEQTNNTYSKSVEANKDALKPVIYQRRNVNLPTPGINGVVGSVVKNYGNRFHQDHYNMRGHHLSIDMVKRRHENLNRRIYQHLQTYQSTSRRCTYGMMDLKWLDYIENLYLKVETPVAHLKELQEINSYRKLICDSIGYQCYNHAYLQKWIAGSRWIVMNSTTQSRERWESLQTC